VDRLVFAPRLPHRCEELALLLDGEVLEASFDVVLAHTANGSGMKPTFFDTPGDFRAWLEANHETAPELLVGFWRKGSGRPSMTWPESVDEALCVGWIDGIRRTVDDERYTIRFTPRRKGSRWSAVNVRRAGELIAEGRMRPAGLAAFEKRVEAGYSYERQAASLSAGDEERFRSDTAAWDHWTVQPPWYRRTLTWWVVSAKREETRRRRLETLIRASREGRRLR
jgi:uncharacterized protein YdeI (YjbR/CyaY-like superfamily)